MRFLREHGFVFFLGLFVLCFLGCVTLISLAPHNDAKMRGFTPCTYQLAEELMAEDVLKQSKVFGIIARGYICYFKVMGEGVKLFYKGQQATPWANYLFKSEPFALSDEVFDEDLEKNSLLKDDNDGELLDNSMKENIDE